MAEVLLEDYMSSDESECDDSGTVVYHVKTLPWESPKLAKRKTKLDNEYRDIHNQRANKRVTPRIRMGNYSSRNQCPSDCPAWACAAGDIPY